MAFLDDLAKALNEAGLTLSQKTKELTEGQKLNSQIRSLKKTINNNYIEIGKAYYEENKGKDGVACADLIKEIAEAEAQIEVLEAEVKAKKGIVVCPSCGTENPIGQKFCGNCGVALPVVEEEAAAKTCPICGEEVPADATTCAKCGAEV